jgi:hypothetical protein
LLDGSEVILEPFVTARIKYVYVVLKLSTKISVVNIVPGTDLIKIPS